MLMMIFFSPLKVAIFFIQLYRIAFSPLFPPCCRFTPSCSKYAEESIQKYGIFRGIFMSFARLLRCHPIAIGGFDPAK